MFPLIFLNLGGKNSFICFTQSLCIFFEILPIIPVHNSLINQNPRVIQDIPFNLTHNPPKTMRWGSFLFLLRTKFLIVISQEYNPSKHFQQLLALITNHASVLHYGCFVIVRLNNLGSHSLLPIFFQLSPLNLSSSHEGKSLYHNR